MLESAVSRNQAADPPQLLQEDPAPPPLHHRFYGTRKANGNLTQNAQLHIIIKYYYYIIAKYVHCILLQFTISSLILFRL